MGTRSVSERCISSSRRDTARPGPEDNPARRAATRSARRVAALLAIPTWTVLLAAALSATAGASKKDSDAVPWTVRLDVHWGAKKNREVYRAGFERALHAHLIESRCFASVDSTDSADLVLDVQLDDFVTEQEYSSSATIIPGQGEDHRLRNARVKVRLDYSLRDARAVKQPGVEEGEILGGRFYREIAREPQSPNDPVEERALRDLTLDASKWVVRELCDRRNRLADKIRAAKGPPKPPPPQSDL